jgi:hypothetical protein
MSSKDSFGGGRAPNKMGTSSGELCIMYGLRSIKPIIKFHYECTFSRGEKEEEEEDEKLFSYPEHGTQLVLFPSHFY